ncbi:MAG TPA: DUF1385 domain-containing protein [Bryobacteraceae bacterium]|nr:DUF1385 domain-containing protein [Bryobacteraceae bacterium]
MTLRRFLRLSAHVQMLPILESGEETLVGGQAVIEGVMMRAPHSYCVAVRKPGGEIVTEEQPLEKVSDKYPIFKLPVLRGLGTLGQAMTLGYKALRFSANAALAEVAPKPAPDAAAKTDAICKDPGKKPAEISSWMMTLNLVFSLGFFIFLYKFVPLFLATRLGMAVPSLSSRFATNMMDGVIRMAIFLTFLYLLSRMKDIHRVFEYHGAEHKVVFNFESKKPVNVENAQKFVTFHPRCGTSFLLVVMAISMIVYALVPVDGFAARFLARIALLPVIAGLSYELIRFAAKRQGTLMGLLTMPGLWLQRITTKPPDDTEVSVAIHALEGAMELEQKQGGELVIA